MLKLPKKLQKINTATPCPLYTFAITPLHSLRKALIISQLPLKIEMFTEICEICCNFLSQQQNFDLFTLNFDLENLFKIAQQQTFSGDFTIKPATFSPFSQDLTFYQQVFVCFFVLILNDFQPIFDNGVEFFDDSVVVRF